MSSQLKYYHNNKSKRDYIELVRCNLSFKSKTALKEYTLKLVSYILDKEIDSTHQYYPFFCDMIDRHFELKFEDGMRFVVHTNEGYNLDNKRSKSKTPYRRSETHRCYCYIPSKGTWHSFSLFNKCINGSNYSDSVLKSRNYRNSVEPQVSIQRKIRKWECEFCHSKKMLDVDHYPISFNQLVRNYENSTPEPTMTGFELYHREHATYRILCGMCHQRHGLRE